MTTATDARGRLGRRVERVWGLVAKEFRQVFRDSRMLRVIFIAPVIQLTVFGYAVQTDLWKTKTFVVDHDRTAASRELIESLTAPGYFDVVGRSERGTDLVRALERGDAIVGIEIPVGFARDLREGRAEVQVLIDGTNSNIASVAQGYVERIVQSYGLRASSMQVILPVDLRERAWFNPDLVSQNYNVPAVAGILILLVCLLLTSLAVVREREIGTLEQLKVSPLNPFELIMGKTIPFGIIGLIDLVLVTAVALAWFQVPFRGSFLLLFAASLLYIGCGLGLGLLLSTVSKTQQEAFMGSFLVLMPTMVLSGFLFPVSSMPTSFQYLTLLNPVRHYLEIVRDIFLKGVGFEPLWPKFVALLLLGVALLGFATLRFRRTAVEE
jgi:ABC-2 type transport system permease protein